MPTRADLINALNAGPVSDETSSVDTDTIKDDALFKEGDCELISADNVRFLVPTCFIIAARWVTTLSYVLTTLSKVFRDMHGLGDGSQEFKVMFTDTAFETASTVRLFLMAAVNGNIRAHVFGNCPDMRQFAMFVDKWDCEQARKLMHSELEVSILQGWGYTLELFSVVATAGNRDLCHLLVRERAAETWPRGSNARLYHRMNAKPGMSVWDVRGWPNYLWSIIPQPYMFALARAHGQGGDLADEFEKYLKLIKPGWRDYHDPSDPEMMIEYYWE